MQTALRFGQTLKPSTQPAFVPENERWRSLKTMVRLPVGKFIFAATTQTGLVDLINDIPCRSDNTEGK